MIKNAVIASESAAIHGGDANEAAKVRDDGLPRYASNDGILYI